VPLVRLSSASRAADRSSSGASGPVATAPTVLPVSAPARPPTWSASRWLSSTSGRSSTPSRSRHRSTGPTSGPASTRIASPGPVGITSASPCPTSQATKTVSSAGQPRVTWRSGQPTSTRAARAASARTRYRRDRHRTATATRISTPSATAPAVPAGQPTAASGRAAARSATTTSQRTGHPATQTSRSATGGHTGATRAAPRPSTVATGTAGAASRLAGTETRLTAPPRPAASGAVARPAAALTARASATGGGHPRSRRVRDHPGASRTMAAVAATDRANPPSRARAGWTSSRTTVAAASAGTAARGRPAPNDQSVTAPIAAARSTLGEGRARITKPASATTAMSTWTLRSTARRRSGQSTAASTIPTFAPETAVRCANPALRNSSSSTGSARLVSPTTSPGSRPAARGGRTRTEESARAARTSPAAPCHQLGLPTAVGGPRADTTATTVSPGRGAATETRARTGWPGTSLRQPSAGANSRTSARSSRRVEPSTRPVTVASAIPRGAPPPPSRCSSPSSRRTASATLPMTSADRSGDASRSQARTAPAPAATADAASTARTAAAQDPRAHRRKPRASSPPVLAAARRVVGGSHGAASVTAHTQAAGGTSRRSTQVCRRHPRATRTPATVTPSPRRSVRRGCSDRSRGRPGGPRPVGTDRAAPGGPRSAGPAPGRSREARRVQPPRRCSG
jgi:hypothetical protein